MKVLLVGLDNPQSSDPRHALFPRPAGCTGDRLLGIIQSVDAEFSMSEYHAVPKTNLFPVGACPKKFKAVYLVEAGQHLRAQLRGRGAKIVLLGNDVRAAVFQTATAPEKPGEFVKFFGAEYAWIPHPSGRNHYYNDPKHVKKIGKFLLETLR